MSILKSSLDSVVRKWAGDEGSTCNVKANNFILFGFSLVGAISAMSFGGKFCKFFWKYFIRPFPKLNNSYGGSWAIITGGSAGIGLELARSLVVEGINVVLIARGAKDLTAAARDLSLLNPEVNVRIVNCDASSPDYLSLMKSLQDIENITMVFNNVGVHNDIPTNVEDMTAEEVNRIISVNCTFQVQFTSLLIPKLKLAKKAVIVNISSLTSKMVMPMLSVYAATKAFEEHWSVNLAAELEPHNIEVICLRPGLTVSRMSGITEPSFFCPSAKTMAHACLRMLGCGENSVAPYWPHALLDVVNGLVPSNLSWGIVRKMHQEKREMLLKAR